MIVSADTVARSMLLYNLAVPRRTKPTAGKPLPGSDHVAFLSGENRQSSRTISTPINTVRLHIDPSLDILLGLFRGSDIGSSGADTEFLAQGH